MKTLYDQSEEFYPSYTGLYNNTLTHGEAELINPFFTDLHLKDNGETFLLCGTLGPCKFKNMNFWNYELKPIFKRNINVWIDDLYIHETPVEDIRFGVETHWDIAHWSKFFVSTPSDLLKKSLQSATYAGKILPVGYQTAILKRSNDIDARLFQGVISSAHVALIDVRYPSMDFKRKDGIFVRGTIKNALCYSVGSGWVIDRPIPNSDEVGDNERILLQGQGDCGKGSPERKDEACDLRGSQSVTIARADHGKRRRGDTAGREGD